MRSSLLLLCALVVFARGDVVEKVAQEAQEAVSRSEAGTARQCTCEEQHECVIELEAQGKKCADMCIAKFNKIAKYPQQLHECFNEAQITIGTLVTCFEDEATTCAAQRTENQVERVDIRNLINEGTRKLLTLEQNLTEAFAGEVREILDTLTNFGTCVKDCVLQENAGGFCFDKKQCQPLLDPKEEAKMAAKKCARQVNFRKHAGDICECAKKAGVENLNKFCPLVKEAAEATKDAIKGSQ